MSRHGLSISGTRESCRFSRGREKEKEKEREKAKLWKVSRYYRDWRCTKWLLGVAKIRDASRQHLLNLRNGDAKERRNIILMLTMLLLIRTMLYFSHLIFCTNFMSRAMILCTKDLHSHFTRNMKTVVLENAVFVFDCHQNRKWPCPGSLLGAERPNFATWITNSHRCTTWKFESHCPLISVCEKNDSIWCWKSTWYNMH